MGRWLVVIAAATAWACGSPAAPASRSQAADTAAAPAEASPAVPGPVVRPRVVFLGDSLTAGLGLAPEESYPSRIQTKIDQQGLAFEVVNAGVSGDTSAGGLRRVDWALDGQVAVLVVALGGNDALRGLPVDDLRRNLRAIIEQARPRVRGMVLAGMEAPPNNGPQYTLAFRRVYPDLAREYDLTLVPFLLAGVAGDPALNQADGIHPNARGAAIVAETVWTALAPLLGSL